MRTIPTADQATPVLTRLAALTAATLKPASKTKPATLDPGICGYIRTAISHHLDIARSHPSQPDGYPTRASGADMGSRGSTGDVELTSVESAVVARTRWKDEHDTLTDYAWQYIQLAVHNLAAAEQVLRKLDGLATPPDGLGLEDNTWCRNHMKHGVNVGRSSDGSLNCTWCINQRKLFGDWPNGQLIDYSERYGRRLPYDIIRLQFPDWHPDTKAG